MAVSAFTSLQFYDCVFSFKIQSAYGTGVTPDVFLAANVFSMEPAHMEVVSYGTTGSRGARSDQHTKSGRLQTFSFEVDLMNTAAIKSVIEWGLGSNSAPTDAVKFATIGVRQSSTEGQTLEDCAVTAMHFVLLQSQMVKLRVEGICLTDWDMSTVGPSGTPAGGTRLTIDDTAFTIQGTELPVESARVSIAQGINPVFANNAYPVSWQVVPHRVVEAAISFPPTSATHDQFAALRNDDIGDLVVNMNSDITITLKDTSYSEVAGAEFTGFNIADIDAYFQAYKPDDATAELGITYA